MQLDLIVQFGFSTLLSTSSVYPVRGMHVSAELR